jgi:hypothetical protein
VPFEGDDGPRLDHLRRDFDDLSGRIREYVDRPGASHATTGTGRDTAPSASAAGAPVDPSARSEARAAGPASHPFEGASMTSDTASARLPRSDDPATADDLTIDTERPVGAATSAAARGPESAGDGPPSCPTYEAQSAPGGASASAAEAVASAGTTTGSRGAPWDSPYGPAPEQQYGAVPGASYGTPPYGTPFYTAGAAAYGPPGERRRRRQHWAGAFLIIVGLLILASNLGLLRWAQPEFMVPMILVVAGAWLLFGRGRRG